MDIKVAIIEKALGLGFDLVGVTTACSLDRRSAYELASWLNAGHAGDMQYLHRHLDKRVNPSFLVDGARSVIVVGLNYKPRADTPRPADRPTGRVALYARYEDYHGFIRTRLDGLVDFISSLTGPAPRFQVCVDSAPVAERALAVRAGLGFIGRNRMLIHPDLGPQVFLGEIITTLELNPDQPRPGSCPDCSACIAVCPTGALRADGVLDARLCINTLTIEHKGEIPPEIAAKIGDRIYGCDECVLACPFHQRSPACANQEFRFCPDRTWLDIKEVLAMDQQTFTKRFSDSPLLRLGLERLKRNAWVCMRNLG